MRIDFHTHGRMSKKLPFDEKYTDNLFKTAHESGLDAICITEHFNTIEFERLYEHMDKNYEFSGGMYWLNGLGIIPGMEVDVCENGHLLMIGEVQDILEFNKRLKPNSKKGEFLSTELVLELATEYNVIKGIAHPFRSYGQVLELSIEILKKFDFVGMNGKDLAILDYDHIHKSTIELGERLGIPCVAGSDTHQSLQYGVIWNDFQEKIHSIEKLREELLKRNYSIEVTKKHPEYVHLAGTLKKSLKEIDRLGGDYISFAFCGK